MNSEKQRIATILELLKQSYPKAHIMLFHKTPWELLVAVMLSAQCTDVMVNKVTPTLFSLYPTIEDVAKAEQMNLEKTVKSTGFYRNKAKHIIAAAKLLLLQFDGRVPKTMDEMITIPGVARKTANVVLANAYNILPGIAVDTHVLRLSERLHLVSSKAYKNPIKTEQELMNLIPQAEWENITYRLIDHGRAVCKAINPSCATCIVAAFCPSRRT